jgi:hypothetical protein
MQTGVLATPETSERGDSLQAILSVASERNSYLAKLKTALDHDDMGQIKLYASKLCGIPVPTTKAS